MRLGEFWFEFLACFSFQVRNHVWKICDFKIEVKPQSLLPAEFVSLVVLKMVPLLHAQISFLCESSRKLNSEVTCSGFDGRIVGHDSYSSISQFSPQSFTDFPQVRNCRTSPVQLLHGEVFGSSEQEVFLHLVTCSSKFVQQWILVKLQKNLSSPHGVVLSGKRIGRGVASSAISLQETEIPALIFELLM